MSVYMRQIGHRRVNVLRPTKENEKGIDDEKERPMQKSQGDKQD